MKSERKNCSFWLSKKKKKLKENRHAEVKDWRYNNDRLQKKENQRYNRCI